MAHISETCGVWDENSMHHCDLSGKAMDTGFCDFPTEDTARIADEDVSTMEYSCNRCGRLAVGAGGVCEPLPIAEPLRSIEAAGAI
jgi:hypothetical protein